MDKVSRLALALPDEKDDCRRTYVSEKILGKLFRIVSILTQSPTEVRCNPTRISGRVTSRT